MPFFPEYGAGVFQQQKKIKNVTLQVRKAPDTAARFRGKRVWLFSFPASASLTAEASVSLSLFLFMMVIFMIPFQIMDTERQVQAALEETGENICQYACIGEIFGKETEEIRNQMTLLYVESQVSGRIKSKAVEKFTMRNSDILGDGIWVDLQADYEIRLPFPVFSLKRISRQSHCLRRAWVGSSEDGNDWREEAGTDGIVYVSKGGSRYHRQRTCRYLYHKTVTISADQLDSQRNRYGRPYTACGTCRPADDASAYVVLEGGEHYHSSAVCRSVTAYVRQVKESEVGGLGPCSWCSGE